MNGVENDSLPSSFGGEEIQTSRAWCKRHKVVETLLCQWPQRR